ncbi:MAG: tripartite tricarboxylate transporter substrate binding protein [Betaproteobacteria bacterium]|nr:tripartite tricarboxylate transporter substrate binding protein [Betaproteobacteria bacterium]
MSSIRNGIGPGALLAFLILTGSHQVMAQAFPNKPIRMVVTAAAGGITDIMTRIMSENIQRTIGQPMIVENRPGAGGSTAVHYTAKSAPDGYTLVIINVGNASIAPWVTKDLPYDPLKDLVGVAAVAEVPSLVVIPDSLPVKTLKEFIEYGRANQGALNYGSAGTATMPHLAAELLSFMTGIKMVHVPYKGAAPAGVDLAAGRIQLSLLGVGSVRAQLAAGTVRVLAVASPTRIPALPNVPTFAEAGLAAYEVTNWFGVLAPAGTPRDVVLLLNNHIGQAFAGPTAVEQLTRAGIVPMKESVEQFQKRIVSDHLKWRDVVKNAGIKPE